MMFRFEVCDVCVPFLWALASLFGISFRRCSCVPPALGF